MSNENLVLGLEKFLQLGEIKIGEIDPNDPDNPGGQLCYGVITTSRE